MEVGSREYWEWFYAIANEGASLSHEERMRATEERWHPDLVMVQSPELPDTRGEFHGYEGLAAGFRELFESWTDMSWEPREIHELADDRYLILVEVGARGRGSGIPLEGGEVGHIVTLRDGKAERMEVYLGWDAARKAVGLA